MSNKMPRYLYHCAPECVFGDINAEGLKSNWGEIYAAETVAHALTFMWFRVLDHVHGTMDSEIGPIVNLVPHDYVYVWEIDTRLTTRKLWSPGADHSASFFGDATSWAYGSKEIERGALSSVKVFSRDDILGALNQPA